MPWQTAPVMIIMVATFTGAGLAMPVFQRFLNGGRVRLFLLLIYIYVPRDVLQTLLEGRKLWQHEDLHDIHPLFLFYCLYISAEIIHLTSVFTFFHTVIT